MSIINVKNYVKKAFFLARFVAQYNIFK